MAAIMFNTPYDNKGYFNATGDLAIKYAEWRSPGNAGTSRPDGATIVALSNPVEETLFAKGTKVKVTTSKGTIIGTISGNASYITTGTPYVWLDLGVNYTNGERWTGGTIALYTEPSVVPLSSKKWLKWAVIAGVVVGGFLLWKKYGKKIGIKK